MRSDPPGDGDRSPRRRAILVIVVGAIILFATITAFMGWLPLAPKNDLLRSLQRGTVAPVPASTSTRLPTALS